MSTTFEQPTFSASVQSLELDPYCTTNTWLSLMIYQEFFLDPCFLDEGKNTDKMAN